MAENVATFMLGRLVKWGVKRVYAYPGDGINSLLGAFEEVSELASSSRSAWLPSRHST